MKQPQIPAKLSRPQAARAVARTRLYKRLDQTRTHPVTWLTGPPGAGKTTLVSGYLDARGLKGIWYQVDTGDNDPATFFHYIGIAARRAAPRYRTPLPVFTPEHRPGFSVFARRYFEALYARLKAPAVLVLDNYQEVAADSAFHAVVVEAAAALPKGMRLLVLSRAEPPAAFARLRANEALSLLDGAELMLTLDETRAVAKLRDQHKLGSAELERLHERTGGWTAGLVLLLERPNLEVPIHAKASGHQVLFDYFATEIFHKLDTTTQSVLCQTALLPEANTAIAQQITGEPGVGQILADLYRRNYFITKQGQGEVYRFHPLFHEFLLQRAQETFPPAQLDTLRSHAAVLLEAAGDSAAAVNLWQAASDWQALETHVLKHAAALAAQARFQTLETWLRRLPEAALNSDGWLLYWLGVCRMPYDPLESRSLFERAYTAFQEKRDPVGLYSAWSGAVDTFFYLWNDFARLDFWINELLALRERHPGELPAQIEARVAYGMFSALLWRQPQNPVIAEWSGRADALMRLADSSYYAMAGNNLYLYYSWWRGEPTQAGGYIERLKHLGYAADIAPLARLMWHVMEASHCGFSNRVPECERIVADGLKLAEGTGVHLLDFLLHAQAVYGKLFAGDAAGGYSHLEQMARAMNPLSRLDAAHYHYQSIWLALVSGDLPTAQRHVSPALEHAIACGAPHAHAFVQLTEAMVKIMVGEADAARPLLDAARAWARGVGNGYVDYHCLLAEAYIHLRAGEPIPAQTCLRRALALGAAKGYINAPWIGWLRPILVELYAFALAQDIESGYVCDLIRRLDLVPADPASAPDTWPWPVKIHTLGAFTVTVRDRALPSTGKQQRKPLDLLKLLVTRGERGLPVEQAAETLYPDMAGTKAYKSYAMALHRLRKLIGENSVLTRDGRIRLDPQLCWVDAWAFDTLLTAGISGAAEHRLERAARLYGGPFLNDECGETWAVTFRERLHRKYLDAILAHGRELEAQRDFEAALHWYRRGLDQDDLMETLYQRILHCCHQLGQRTEGLATYERCRVRLRDALGIAPAPQTDALRNALIATG